MASLDLPIFVWLLKGLSGEEEESARPWTLPVRNGQGVNRPHLGLESQGIKKGECLLPASHPPGPDTKIRPPGQETGAREGAGSLARGVPPTGSLEEQASLCADPPVPFSHFSKWEAHVRAPRPPGSHTSTVRWAYTHSHTQSGQQPQQRGDQGLGTTRERRHYRSCEDPLKPLVGLLCGGQLDVGGSSCLKVKPLLVPAWGTGGTAHQASSSGSHWDPRGLAE